MDRHTQPLKTQGVQHVQFNFSFVGAGAAAPTLGEGDPNGTYIKTITRNSQGNYSFTTVDKFLAVVTTDGTYSAATVTTSWGVTFGLPSQNSDGTWTFNFVTYVSNTGTATDIIASDLVSIQITFRNSLVKP